MIDYYLKFSSKEEALGVLYHEGVLKYVNTDIIGTIYKPTGEIINIEEDFVPATAAIPGWHVNIRTDYIIPELEIYNVIVKTPVRIWA